MLSQSAVSNQPARIAQADPRRHFPQMSECPFLRVASHISQSDHGVISMYQSFSYVLDINSTTQMIYSILPKDTPRKASVILLGCNAGSTDHETYTLPLSHAGPYSKIRLVSCMVFITVFNGISFLSQRPCIYPCFPGILLTITPHNILSKLLVVCPYDHCPKKWKAGIKE